MLVLTRRVGEQLVISDDIRVTVTRISGNRITLSVDAPQEVRVRRGELKQIETKGVGDGSDSENGTGGTDDEFLRIVGGIAPEQPGGEGGR